MSISTSDSQLTVLMFTDLVGSVAMKTRLGDADYANHVLRPHNQLLKNSVAGLNGARIERDTGDGFLITFARASDAVTAALAFQHAIRTFDWKG